LVEGKTLPPVESYEEFAWLQGGPHLEVGFLIEVKTSLEEFLSNFLDILKQTTPKAEFVSSPTELDEEKKEFLTGYPWDGDDKSSFIVHAWNGLVQFQFQAKRESSIKIWQISETVIHVNFYFWGDQNDGWGQKGLKNDELPDFVVFLKSLGRLLKFEVGTIGFHAWAIFLFSTNEDWGHSSYALKNLTRERIESRAHDSAHPFIYVVARNDFLDNGDNLPEENGYFILKIDDILKQRT
jgi:hypothetical protein